MTSDAARIAALQGAQASPAGGYLANVLIAFSLAYTLAFNHLDENTRVALAGPLGLLLVARCLISWPRRDAQAATLLFAGLALLPAFHFIFVMDPRAHSLADYAGPALRLMTCIAVFVYFGFERQTVSPILVKILCISILVMALAVAATGAPVMYASVMRPATFTGGEEGVHASGYVVTSAFIATVTLWRLGRLGTGWLVLLATPLLALTIAFQVRTTWTMLLVFAFASVTLAWRARCRDGTWLLLPIGGAVALLVFLLASASMNVSEFSSGRSEAYIERMDLIFSRPPVEFLVGTGPGSEVLPSNVWWWEAKNSHNDFIDLAIQIGLVGLILIVLLVTVTLRGLDQVQLALFLTFVASSLISNGLFTRPFVAVLFLAVALVPAKAPAQAGSLSRHLRPAPT